LIYGMGERATVQIAEALDSGIDAKDIKWIKGTCVRGTEDDIDDETVILPAFEEICADRDKYGESFALQYRNNDQISGKRMAERYDKNLFVIQNIPQKILTTDEMDQVYELPYERDYHPCYEAEGGVPALSEVKFSITGTRGCFGGCSFCALTYHQGREVVSRSKDSIVREAEMLSRDRDFKGYIHDIGGPTANFRKPACRKQLKCGVCKDRDCMYPEPCPSMDIDHTEYLEVLKAVRELPGIKKVFIRSGIRYDYLMADRRWQSFMKELCEHHVSGTLKVAPEHASPNVLAKMRKPRAEVFERFSREYGKMNKKLGKKQYLIPYMISSHPGSRLEDAVELALFLKKSGFIPDQVQDFYPTPGTLATCMYYTGRDPLTGEKVYVPRDMEEKKMQRALMHFHKKENHGTVKKALERAGRTDLIDTLPGKGASKTAESKKCRK
ncbi:MAG: YgiQ family radical SAM protein, partial [Firmicutes bacterium]|nr:YgiQ family radical SAM protein [Bacillota bacterium]